GQLNDDARLAAVERRDAVGVEHRLPFRDAAEPGVHLRAAYELGEGAPAVRRRAVARAQEADGAALGEQLEGGVAHSVDDDDMEALSGRAQAGSRRPRRGERDARAHEHGKQTYEADRPDHQLSILTESRRETNSSSSGPCRVLLEQLLEARCAFERGKAGRALEPLLATPPDHSSAAGGGGRRPGPHPAPAG